MFEVGECVYFNVQEDGTTPYVVIAKYGHTMYDLKYEGEGRVFFFRQIEGYRLKRYYGPKSPMTLSIQGLLFVEAEKQEIKI